MTDEKNKQGQPAIQIISQYVKDLSFENPNAPESLVGKWPQPETGVHIFLRHQPLGDSAHECVVNLKIEAKRKDDGRAAFILDLSYGAVVGLHNVPAENTVPALMVEVPRLLFPFIREIVAATTAKGGFPPLFISPISFETLYINEMKRLQAEQGKQASA